MDSRHQPTLNFGLLLHNHQPVGNYGFVIEQLYAQAYEPMLAALERHPGVRLAIHNSGPLCDWIEANHPEYMRRLRALCDRGQVEMVSGGYYEPVLPMIPDIDKAGQIEKMTAFIQERFGQRPTGLWLTERVWEPGLPVPLSRAGVEWTLVDDAHFHMVGLHDDDLDGYYITEDQGGRLKIFPGSQRLRYTIPWLAVDDVIAELRALAEAKRQREAPLIVLGDDGEKFGGWPTTYAHVWENGWMDAFFTAIEAERDWLHTVTPGQYARRHEARGLVYLPTASYAEMMEWAMPAAAGAQYHKIAVELQEAKREDVLQYVRGGFWRYFLAKYPEVNAMHKRGLRINRKLDEKDNADARDALWQAQCNCPYWHGVFGGIYLRHIRSATNANLVRAERLADEAMGRTQITIAEEDFDYDGQRELLIQTPSLSLMVHPRDGGMISELDVRARDHALLGVLMRRPEAYHHALLEGNAGVPSVDLTNIHGGVRLKDQELATEHLVFDRHRRAGLQEWILGADEGVHALQNSAGDAMFEPAGEWTLDVSLGEGGASLRMIREANGWRVEKQVYVPADAEQLSVMYECTNTTDQPRAGRFVSEWNVSVPHRPDGDDRTAAMAFGNHTVDVHTEPGSIDDVHAFTLRGSAEYGVLFEIEGRADVWHFPVMSVSSSEGGLERTVQGASVSIARRLDLGPGASASLRFSVGITEL